MSEDELADLDALISITTEMRRIRLRASGATDQTVLLDALGLAVTLVESYAMDVRAGIADGRVAAGFCQGRIYREALSGLARRLQAPPDSAYPLVDTKK